MFKTTYRANITANGGGSMKNVLCRVIVSIAQNVFEKEERMG
jgi:hypothetical protein